MDEVMNLLVRFYDLTGGTISIDGIPVHRWPLADLRRSVGIVQQDIALFSGSVVDNIRFFRAGGEIPILLVTNDNDLIASARRLGAHTLSALEFGAFL